MGNLQNRLNGLKTYSDDLRKTEPKPNKTEMIEFNTPNFKSQTE